MAEFNPTKWEVSEGTRGFVRLALMGIGLATIAIAIWGKAGHQIVALIYLILP